MRSKGDKRNRTRSYASISNLAFNTNLLVLLKAACTAMDEAGPPMMLIRFACLAPAALTVVQYQATLSQILSELESRVGRHQLPARLANWKGKRIGLPC